MSEGSSSSNHKATRSPCSSVVRKSGIASRDSCTTASIPASMTRQRGPRQTCRALPQVAESMRSTSRCTASVSGDLVLQTLQLVPELRTQLIGRALDIIL